MKTLRFTLAGLLGWTLLSSIANAETAEFDPLDLSVAKTASVEQGVIPSILFAEFLIEDSQLLLHRVSDSHSLSLNYSDVLLIEDDRVKNSSTNLQLMFQVKF